MQMIPPIGASGPFRFKAPFNTRLDPNETYTCIALRQFNDVVHQGRDPVGLYYAPHDLSEEDYERDALAGAVVVSLQALSSARVIQFSSHYIESYPQQGGIPYEVLALVTRLGPIANETDLSFLEAEVKDLVLNLLGIEAETRLVKTSPTHYLDQEEHNRLIATREELVSQNRSFRAQLLEAQAINAKLSEENTAMREFISANLP